MKLALFTVTVLTACANELVLGVKKKQDEAMNAPSAAPETLLETLAHLLAPMLELLYIVVLPLAFVALLCAFCVFAPRQAFALVLLPLIPAIGWIRRH
jgi:hypothetical protein